MEPPGFYPSRGHDQWVAIAARDDQDWQALASAIGADAALSPTIETRRQRAVAIDALISAWTATRDKHRAAALLSSAGVPAAAVTDAPDVFT